MANFWERALGVQPQAPQPQPHWSTPQTAPATPQTPYPAQGYQPPQGLAVAPTGQAANPVVPVIQEQGYLKRPPQWVQTQPGDRCPNCQGVNFVYSGEGEGTAGMKRRTKVGDVSYGHCFDCSYTLNGGRALSAGQIGNFGMKSLGAGRVEATRQGQQGMKNFFRIEGHL